MKTIGLIGGMSWESTLEYYRLLNEMIKERLGGFHSVQCVMYSFDFADIEQMQYAGEWDQATDAMIDAARRMEKAGADCMVICTNTMHKMADEVQGAIQVPLLHIVDITASAIHTQNMTCVGLLGTKFTMNEPFYVERLQKQGLQVILPDEAARVVINRVIYEELVLGIIKPESRTAYVEIIDQLASQGAQGVILGCTEIELLIKPEDSPIPTFATTYLHAAAAVDFALS